MIERYKYNENGKIVQVLCTRCKEWKEPLAFYVSKQNSMYYYTCKQCISEVRKLKKIGIREYRRKSPFIRDAKGNIIAKICPKCKQEKPIEMFTYFVRSNTYCSYCKPCMQEHNRQSNKKYSKLYKSARKPPKLVVDDDLPPMSEINPHEYNGVYCLINPLLRRCII